MGIISIKLLNNITLKQTAANNKKTGLYVQM